MISQRNKNLTFPFFSLLPLIFFLMIHHPQCYGAPKNGVFHQFKQPDGALVDVRVWGDEHHQIVESMDGYTLVRDPETKRICYAVLDDRNQLISSGYGIDEKVIKSDIKKHLRPTPGNVNHSTRTFHISKMNELQPESTSIPTMNSSYLTEGVEDNLYVSIRGLCLLVDFPDEPGTVPPGIITDFCNQIGFKGYGNNGSVRDYFYDVSAGKIVYTNVVTDTYYRALYHKGYYDDPAKEPDLIAKELILEALNDLESSGFDFSEFDSDGDGIIDVINCLYAGTHQSGWSTGLSPHAGNFSSELSFTADGVQAGGYQICEIGSFLTLGIFCHESGHLLFGWPDLYDTNFSSYGVGQYCLMSYGGIGTNPVEPCAYLKYISGWANVTEMNVYENDLSITASSNHIYKYTNPENPNEYFLLENRQQNGRDASLPDSGIALWHIDENGSNDDSQQTLDQHYLVTLLQADGRWDLEKKKNRGDSTDLFKSPDSAICGPYLNVLNPLWWDQTHSGFEFHDVSTPSPAMTFSFRSDPLKINTEEHFLSTGPAGGVFRPGSFLCTLINTGDTGIDYEVMKVQPWLTLLDDNQNPQVALSGTLESFESKEFALQLDESVESFPKGLYSDILMVTNQNSQLQRARIVSLDIEEEIFTLCETDFSHGFPNGWFIMNGHDDEHTWSLEPVDFSSPFLTEPFAFLDCFSADMSVLDEQLISPSIDCSNHKEITLSFSQELSLLTTPFVTVDISIASQPWQTVATYSEILGGDMEIPLTQAEGQEDVRIRWYLTRPVGSFDIRWGVDNIKIAGKCASVRNSDVNYDCRVDMLDMLEFAKNWLNIDCGVSNEWCLGSDIDRNSKINLIDYSVLSGDWLSN